MTAGSRAAMPKACMCTAVHAAALNGTRRSGDLPGCEQLRNQSKQAPESCRKTPSPAAPAQMCKSQHESRTMSSVSQESNTHHWHRSAPLQSMPALYAAADCVASTRMPTKACLMSAFSARRHARSLIQPKQQSTQQAALGTALRTLH